MIQRSGSGDRGFGLPTVSRSEERAPGGDAGVESSLATSLRRNHSSRSDFNANVIPPIFFTGRFRSRAQFLGGSHAAIQVSGDRLPTL